MSKDLNEIVLFAKVVEMGGFREAARALAVPKSTVSRKVAALEERLGARLVERTTRSLRITDAGNALYHHAARIVRELDAAELAVTRLQEVPRGLLRVTTPLNFRYAGRLVTTFLARHPDVQVEMLCTDRVMDLIAENIDVAIRVGRLADSSLIARPLGTLVPVLVASPGFLAEHGCPEEPGELAHYPCVVFGPVASGASWRLEHGDEQCDVVVSPRLVVNDMDVLFEAVVGGAGIGMLPAGRAGAAIAADRLRRVLPAWTAPPLPLQAVYPSARHLAPKVKAFVDHFRDEMGAL